MIDELEKKLYDFYSHNPDYYSDINLTAHNWQKVSEKGYLKILELVSHHISVCEIGYKNANLLKHFPQIATTCIRRRILNLTKLFSFKN